MTQDLLEVQRNLRDHHRPYAVATVVETEGSVSAKTGAKAVIDAQGQVLAGWVGGGCAESNTCEQALRCLATGETAMLDIDMNDEMLGVGMPCGGSMRVYVEPVLPAPTLWIMGHGRVAETLCRMAALSGLRVVVDDPQVETERYPDAERLITDDIDYAELQPAPDDYVLIATQHKGDHDSLCRALNVGAGYIALIASRKRAGLVMDFLRERGFGDSELEPVHAPAGLDLGARTPEEIALCVLSEIVCRRRGGSGRPMREIVAESMETANLLRQQEI